MDTQTLPTKQVSKAYVQMPQNIEHVIAFDNYLNDNGWKRKDMGDYYNKHTREYSSAQELYPKFINIKQ